MIHGWVGGKNPRMPGRPERRKRRNGRPGGCAGYHRGGAQRDEQGETTDEQADQKTPTRHGETGGVHIAGRTDGGAGVVADDGAAIVYRETRNDRP